MAKQNSTLSDQELLARLVAFNSASPNDNLPIAEFICDYLDRPGIRIERQPSPEGDKVNLVITAGPEVDPLSRVGLTLCGHLDVVPADEPGWDSDPFKLTDTGEKLVGRGSADMKGFVALATNVLAGIAPGSLERPLGLLLTYDEEVGTLGARHFADSWLRRDRPLPRQVIVGEPTSLEVVRMHKGFTKIRVTVEGRSAHSGYPHLGKSAIEPAARVVAALADLRRELTGEACPNGEYFGEVPFVALNVGTIHGGAAFNVIPDRCELGISFRILPGMESGPITERLRATVAGVLGEQPHRIDIIDDSPPLFLSEDHDLYRGLTALLGQERTVSASYATDAGWLQQADLDCLLWGPGSIEVAHRPNEAMPKDEFRRGSELLREIVAAYCCTAS